MEVFLWASISLITFCTDIHPFLSLSAAYLNTGIVLMNQGRLEEAKRTFVTCADIPDENLKDPHAHKSSVTSCLYNLGKLLHEQGHQEVRRSRTQSKPLDLKSVHTKSDVIKITRKYKSRFSHHNFSDQCWIVICVIHEVCHFWAFSNWFPRKYIKVILASE